VVYKTDIIDVSYTGSAPQFTLVDRAIYLKPNTLQSDVIATYYVGDKPIQEYGTAGAVFVSLKATLDIVDAVIITNGYAPTDITLVTLNSTQTSGYIQGFAEKTTVSAALACLAEDSAFLQFKKADGTLITGNQILGTGCTVNLVIEGETIVSYTLVVAGDTNGDGLISSADYLQLRSFLKGQTVLTGAYELAADFSCTGGVSTADYLLLRIYLKGGAL